MKKNSWILTGLSLLSMPTWADNDSANDIDIIFYGGLAGGGAYHDAQIDRNFSSFVTTPSVSPPQPVSQSTLPFSGDIHEFAGVGQLQIGAGLRYEFLYLGIEALGQLSNGDFGSTQGEFDLIGVPAAEFPSSIFKFDSHLQTNDFEPAIDFKPGLFLSDDILLYGRVGAAWNEVSLSDNAHYDLINHGALLMDSVTQSENVIALRLGLGVEHYLQEQFTIFMDYTYTNYGDVSLTKNNNISGILEPGGFPLDFQITDYSTASDINKQVVMLGFNYYL